ncbi:MAG TPA: alpha/beta hydrolase [Aldersonia sp.]
MTEPHSTGRALGTAVFAAVAAAASLTAVAGCAAQGTATADAAALDRYYHQQIDWQPCADLKLTVEGPGRYECAFVTVPIDYADPGGATAQIAVSRSKATGTRIGSLLANPGGPGASGLGMAALGADTELAEHFDVVGFDPRGIGASTPSIECLTSSEADAARAEVDLDTSPEAVERHEQDARNYVAACTDRTGADLLAHVGTQDVVRDMDVIRAALGDEQLTYVGYSYGTRIGAQYAEMFPTHVRALVLDGALDPAQDLLSGSIDQMAGFQQAFDAFAADCATRGEECPLGTDPAQATARYRALVDPLILGPATTADPRGLSYGDAHTGTIQALYSEEFWPYLYQGLVELQEGRGDTLLQLADVYLGREPSGIYNNQSDAFAAVHCLDDQRITDRAALTDAAREVAEVAPFLDSGTEIQSAPLDVCAFWPVPPSGPTPHQVDAPELPNVVVISTTGDPATPYQAGIDLAEQLGGSLITVEGSRHGAFLAEVSSCVDRAAIDYLVDLTPPGDGLRCAPDAA